MLTTLIKGQIARIEEINAAPRTMRRLAEMGLMPGATLEMLRPGRPCIVRVNHTRLSLGRALQQVVRVAADGQAA